MVKVAAHFASMLYTKIKFPISNYNKISFTYDLKQNVQYG